MAVNSSLSLGRRSRRRFLSMPGGDSDVGRVSETPTVLGRRCRTFRSPSAAGPSSRRGKGLAKSSAGLRSGGSRYKFLIGSS
jgi:hypothetical protein